jgi:hypothetical protein
MSSLETGNKADGEHNRGDQPRFPVAGYLEDRPAHCVRYTGLEQAAGHHIHGPDGDHGRIGKTAEEILAGDQAQHTYGDEHQ